MHPPQVLVGVGVASATERGEPTRELYGGQHRAGADGHARPLGFGREDLHAIVLAAQRGEHGPRGLDDGVHERLSRLPRQPAGLLDGGDGHAQVGRDGPRSTPARRAPAPGARAGPAPAVRRARRRRTPPRDRTSPTRTAALPTQADRLSGPCPAPRPNAGRRSMTTAPRSIGAAIREDRQQPRVVFVDRQPFGRGDDALPAPRDRARSRSTAGPRRRAASGRDRCPRPPRPRSATSASDGTPAVSSRMPSSKLARIHTIRARCRGDSSSGSASCSSRTTTSCRPSSTACSAARSSRSARRAGIVAEPGGAFQRGERPTSIAPRRCSRAAAASRSDATLLVRPGAGGRPMPDAPLRPVRRAPAPARRVPRDAGRVGALVDRRAHQRVPEQQVPPRPR